MAHTQKIYDLVETFIAENEEEYSLIEKDEIIKLAFCEELEELFETGEYTYKDLKEHIADNLITNIEYAENGYGVDEETLNKFVLIADDLGWDLRNELLERAEDIQIYNMEEREFVTYMVEELKILGEVDEKALNFMDTNHIWESLLRFDFSEVPRVGYVYTSL